MNDLVVFPGSEGLRIVVQVTEEPPITRRQPAERRKADAPRLGVSRSATEKIDAKFVLHDDFRIVGKFRLHKRKSRNNPIRVLRRKVG